MLPGQRIVDIRRHTYLGYHYTELMSYYKCTAGCDVCIVFAFFILRISGDKHPRDFYTVVELRNSTCDCTIKIE